jgi:ATP-binding cassette, subfamily C (CFTR/MRP), member 1
VAIVALIAEPMGSLLATRAMFEASLGSFIRIQEFLLLSDKSDSHAFVDKRFSDDEQSGAKQKHASELTGVTNNEPLINIRNATFESDDGKVLLRDVNFTAKQGSCHVIAGLVGCGKSSVLKAIMGELKLAQGSMEVREDAVAYCAQSPWLRNATVRENIVGGAEFGFDADWFARVVRACALDQDFAGNPDWYNNLVGSGGVILSGGQKQRVVGAPRRPA